MLWFKDPLQKENLLGPLSTWLLETPPVGLPTAGTGVRFFLKSQNSDFWLQTGQKKVCFSWKSQNSRENVVNNAKNPLVIYNLTIVTTCIFTNLYVGTTAVLKQSAVLSF